MDTSLAVGSKELLLEEEKRLVERARAGERQAVAAIYQEHFDRVYRYIALRVGDRMEAEDLTQQVFLKAMESLASFRWRGSPLIAWLFRIAHNVVINHLRRAAKREASPLDEQMVAAVDRPEAVVELKLTLEQLNRAMEQLTELQRQVIALRFAGGLSLAETARAMDKKEGAIKALQHSALNALRRTLKVE